MSVKGKNPRKTIMKELQVTEKTMVEWHDLVQQYKPEDDEGVMEVLPDWYDDLWKLFDEAVGEMAYLSAYVPPDIIGTVYALREARKSERIAAHALVITEAEVGEAKREIEKTERVVVGKLFGAGKIDGKNTQERDAQIGKFLAESDEMQRVNEEWLRAEAEVRSARHKYDKEKDERQFYEDLLSAQRALLYADRSSVVVNVEGE